MKIYFGFYLSVLLASTLLIFGQNCYAQSAGFNDLSQVRVDDLSNEQILLYMRQAESMGLSEDE